MNWLRILAPLGALCVATQAWAGDADTGQATFTAFPQPPLEGHFLRLKIDNEAGCFDGGDQAEVVRTGNELLVKFYGVDHECPDAFRTPLFARLGVLEQGNYHMVVQLCPAPPGPCWDIDEQAFGVGALTSPFRIPTLSFAGMLAGVCGVAAMAVVLLRRRTGR